jgi:D-amino peptidase
MVGRKQVANSLSLVALVILGLNVASAQQKKLKVYISADMEGVDGVVTWDVQGMPTGREYQEFRRVMTQEVNAAIAGAFKAGATEVLVSDDHHDGQNLDLELLDPRVELIRGGPTPLGMMQGIDSSFAAVVFIGYHAGEGQPGVLSHSFTGSWEIKINNQVVPEAGFNAAIAGDFGVPVVFLSGDQIICDEARRLLGAIETVAVKQAIGFNVAKMIPLEKARALIEQGVQHGVEHRSEQKPFRVARPVRLDVSFKNVLPTEKVSFIPGVERTSGNTVVFTAPNMVEASKFEVLLEELAP